MCCTFGAQTAKSARRLLLSPVVAREEEMDSRKPVEPRKEPAHARTLLPPRAHAEPAALDEPRAPRVGDRDSCEASLWSEWSVARRYVSFTGGREDRS
jgi:hypothetical protein